ncbi:hypothetical protein [Escherichia coli]|uniref:hypothetical protein n=1 Tax=Escherichia coli TaxID=562 RepID=UPI0004862B07|nr:hypothetical protein [Escherichia coli]
MTFSISLNFKEAPVIMDQRRATAGFKQAGDCVAPSFKTAVSPGSVQVIVIRKQRILFITTISSLEEKFFADVFNMNMIKHMARLLKGKITMIINLITA